MRIQGVKGARIQVIPKAFELEPRIPDPYFTSIVRRTNVIND
jgi:hypothetical protein